MTPLAEQTDPLGAGVDPPAENLVFVVSIFGLGAYKLVITNQSMSNQLIPMSKVRQILRLYTQGVGKKNISRKAGATRNTVKRYIHQYIAIGKTLDELEKLNDTDLEKLFMAKEPAVMDKKLQDLYDYFPQVEKGLKRKGATRVTISD